MLGKLIKYDLKATAKVFLLLHIVYFIICLASRFLFMDRLDFNGDKDLLLAQVIVFSSAMLILFVLVNSGTWLLFTVRFYRNLFSKEGYLTWTLPASGVQHLWAKIISGWILYAVDVIVLSAGIVLLVTGQNVTDAYAAVAAEVTAEFGMPISTFGIYMFVLSFLSGICAVISSYFCVAAGQLFPSHRVIGAVAVYFITSACVQVLTMLILAASGHFSSDYFAGVTAGEGRSVVGYLFEGLWGSILLMFAIAAVQYAVMHFIMKKKINLI